MTDKSTNSGNDNVSVMNSDNQERRKHIEQLDELDKGAFSIGAAWLDDLISGFSPADIYSARGHSEDFKDTRAEYISLRLRFMLIFYVLAVPLFLLLNYFLIRPEFFTQMAKVHLLFPAVLVLLFAYTKVRTSLKHIDSALALTVFATLVFYGSSVAILNGDGNIPLLAGYGKMPHLLVVMLALFPLTLQFGLMMVFVTLVAFFIVQYMLLQLGSFEMYTDLWLLLLFAGIALWIQAGQLLMLLRLYRESTRDALTGLINRRVLVKLLDSEQARADQGDHCFSVLMFDLDRFKRINDNYGHLIGDQVLKKVADVLTENLRSKGLLARYGGEEFVAVLQGARGPDAVKVAERLRRDLEDTIVITPGGDEIQLQSSIGVTEFVTGEAISEMMSRVDDLLYSAKAQGRNRVVYSYDGLTGSPG